MRTVSAFALSFLSTPSARRATALAKLKAKKGIISIHALREEGDVLWRDLGADRHISIHALREEGDPKSSPPPPAKRYFYPRPPRGGRLSIFFFTHINVCISIHALREEGDCTKETGYTFANISIHALREEGDERDARTGTRYKISIHALREEGDGVPVQSFHDLLDFYPRPPRGGRLVTREHLVQVDRFLSTPSARRATPHGPERQHVLGNFYPRPPRGGRRT